MLKRFQQGWSFRAIVMLIWALFAITLTTQSDRIPVVHLMTTTIGSTEFGDVLGHAGLFGMFTAVAYFAFARWLPGLRALLLAMVLALFAGTTTELYQIVVADRSASLSDLLANWLGIFVTGFVIAGFGNRSPAVLEQRLPHNVGESR